MAWWILDPFHESRSWILKKNTNKTCLGRFQDCGRGNSKYPLWSGWAQRLGEPSKIKFCFVNPLPGATFVCWPRPILKANTPIWWGGPCRPRGEVTPQNKALLCKPTRGATFVCWLLLQCLSYYPHLVGWTLWAQGWSEPPQAEIYRANPPQGATFVCCPSPNYFSWYPYLIGWTLQGPWLEWVPQKLNFTKQTHPKEQLFVCWPPPYSHCKQLHLVE